MEIKFGHFKYGYDQGEKSDEEWEKLEEDPDNYYQYTHFMLQAYEGSVIQKISFSSFQSAQDCCCNKCVDNRNRNVISYYCEGVAVSTEVSELKGFERGKMYDMSELINYSVFNTNDR